MGTEGKNREEVDRMDTGRPGAPPDEEALEEENPVESPANQSRDGDEERAASSDEPPQPVAKSTEGLTVGGSEELPAGSDDDDPPDRSR
jgi:hypothetical protein